MFKQLQYRSKFLLQFIVRPVRIVQVYWTPVLGVQKVRVLQVDIGCETAEVTEVHEQIHEEHKPAELHPGKQQTAVAVVGSCYGRQSVISGCCAECVEPFTV